MNEKRPDTQGDDLLRTYFRLLLSEADFKIARRCAETLVDRPVSAESSERLQQSALSGMLAVSYSRPFNSKGMSRVGWIAPLRVEMIARYSDDDLLVHQQLMFSRNKLVAHTDAEVADADPFIAADLPGDLVVPLRNASLSRFTEDFVGKALAVATKAHVWCVEERHRVEPTVKHLLPRRNYASYIGVSDTG